jgi:hypothetical protein
MEIPVHLKEFNLFFQNYRSIKLTTVVDYGMRFQIGTIIGLEGAIVVAEIKELNYFP